MLLPKHLRGLFKRLSKSIYFLPILLFSIVLLSHLWHASQHIIFTQDQARDIYIVRSSLESNHLIFGYGPKTSVGDFTVFPLYYQIFGLVHSMYDHPLSMHYTVTVLESLTPVFLYLILIQFVRKRTALVAAAAYASFYLVLLFSTYAWSPNLLPLFSTVSLWAWLRYLHRASGKHLVVAIFFLGLSIHLHFQSFILIPFGIIVFITSHGKLYKTWKYWLIGCVLAACTFVPYFAAEISNDWQNTREIVEFYTQDHRGYYDRVSKPEYVLTFYPALFERIMFGINTQHFWFGRVLFFSGIIFLLIQGIRNNRHRWLLVYFLLSIIMVRMFKGDKHDYYLLTFMIFPSIFLAFVIDMTKRWIFWLSVVIIVLLFIRNYFSEPRNQYQSLAAEVESISEILREHDTVHLVIHELDSVNSIMYFLSQDETLRLDRESPTIVDICKNSEHCIYNPLALTPPTQMASYSATIKMMNSFQQCVVPTGSNNFSYTVVNLGITKGKILPEKPTELKNRKDMISETIN